MLDGDATALSDQARQGMSVFAGKGDCVECHTGAAMSTATTAAVTGGGPIDDDTGANDTGFFNIGVRPTASDAGNGGSDPFGAPLSEARLAATPATAVDGSFKTPGLRNVALTAPYFHNGGKGTLRQVVDFYDRGGDFPNAEKNVSIKPLGLGDSEKDALVAFLESLTDERVRDQAAPFDHPQLFVPAGAQTRDDGSVLTDASGRAVDCFKEVAATGASGGAPLPRFPAFTGRPCADPAFVSEGAPPPSAGAVTLRVPSATVPAARSCTSKRSFTIRMYRPRGDRFRRIIVTVDGRRVADLRGSKLGRAPVDLRGLPRGVVKVQVIARTAKGRRIFTQRSYRTCTRRGR